LPFLFLFPFPFRSAVPPWGDCPVGSGRRPTPRDAR